MTTGDSIDAAADEPTRAGVAFLLAQLGSMAADRFAERASTLELTPPLSGVLRAVAARPRSSQQSLAEHLGVPPSRLVGLLDELEQRGALTRTPRSGNRRRNDVALTSTGRDLLKGLARMAREHDDAITAPLPAAERRQLRAVLARLAAAHGLTRGVHPGYRRLPPAPRM